MLLKLMLVFALLLNCELVFAGAAGAKPGFEPWHTTHGLEKFPCMNDEETSYFQRLINVAKNEERKNILTDHRKSVRPSSRRPASLSPQNIVAKNYICPPFRGVRNPHPQVIEFGKASTFERIRLTDNELQILSGLSKNQKWNLSYRSEKGYFEGQTSQGTPIDLIPMVPPQGERVRFLVQYLLWKDKTPPTLTLCYREDLHNQCNPYKKPEPPALAPTNRHPAAVQTDKKRKKS